METMELEKVDLTRIKECFTQQQQQAHAQRSEPVENRKKRLRALREWIKKNREPIQQAVYADFKKPPVEVDATEIFPALDEIKVALDNLDQWTKSKKIDASLTMLGTRSHIMYEPKGVCLIIAPWNYPFNLCIGPLASALAAGNTAILKPSELTPHTSALITKMCKEIFNESEVTVFEGGPEVSQALLALPFDHIFFTGSPAIGKVVMRAASENLTSVTLELGGKSPTVVGASAKIKEAAQRIAVAKFINNGQTCIAPDYVLVHKSIAGELISHLKEQINSLFGESGKPFDESPNYARIVNQKHTARLNGLLQDAIEHGAKLELHGNFNLSDRFLHPVLLSDVAPTSRIMEEEIFGPILPIISFDSFSEVLQTIQQKPKPLALYYFGSNNTELNQLKNQTSAGAMCINDCAIHFLNLNIPFGGVNNSGFGKSHGHYGFLAFSNEKPVMRQRHGLTSVKFFYPPYTTGVKRMIDWLLKMV
jgi:aldehyde dehydrogenase (NAD+)